MAKTRDIELSVNGTAHRLTVEPRRLLVHTLRLDLGLTGTHIGCETGQCGACVVLVDGEPAKSCNLLAVQADLAEIETIEGLAQEGRPHPIQEAFCEKYAVQCGYCTPGLILCACELLRNNPHPSEEDICSGIYGNLCRCTGYRNIVGAIQYAGELMESR